MRNKLLPLSETMHYILLVLREPLHGYAIMQVIREMSENDVNIAAGTLYGAIENLKKHQYIRSLSDALDRRKVYIITELGEEVLKVENERLKHLVKLYEDGPKSN
ncbi:PadR family transcriptional regulator [Staphylococcus massiliensis]|uniref:PadR family transcriptional regulator n=1 Tax=Staphylococcus massiliensis TaxID=555791 RepID=UPI00370DAC2B